jgi:hypothetical protein
LTSYPFLVYDDLVYMGMVKLQPDLHKRLKHVAADVESTISKLVHEGLERFVSEAEKSMAAKNGRKAGRK